MMDFWLSLDDVHELKINLKRGVKMAALRLFWLLIIGDKRYWIVLVRTFIICWLLGWDNLKIDLYGSWLSYQWCLRATLDQKGLVIGGCQTDFVVLVICLEIIVDVIFKCHDLVLRKWLIFQRLKFGLYAGILSWILSLKPTWIMLILMA